LESGWQIRSIDPSSDRSRQQEIAGVGLKEPSGPELEGVDSFLSNHNSFPEVCDMGDLRVLSASEQVPEHLRPEG